MSMAKPSSNNLISRSRSITTGGSKKTSNSKAASKSNLSANLMFMNHQNLKKNGGKLNQSVNQSVNIPMYQSYMLQPQGSSASGNILNQSYDNKNYYDMALYGQQKLGMNMQQQQSMQNMQKESMLFQQQMA